MRKTSFFYDINVLLMVVLAWMLLMNESVRMNGGIREKKEKQEAEQEEKKEENGEEQPLERKEQWTEETNENAEENTEMQHAQNEIIQTGNSGQNADKASMIRVLLMDTDYQSYFHSEVRVLSDGETYVYTPESEEFEEGSVTFPDEEDGIEILSIERQQGNPVYQGMLEIEKTDQGLLLINELPLETYLESVVPSEMPSSYAAEALKAQAICARTYACRQIRENRLEEYHADVDDSVSFQVYGNIAPQERTSAAVKETEGQVLCQDGELIQAYYFSTSAGVTSTDEIWGADEPAPYLKTVACAFDQEEPWSSWSVTIPWTVLSKRCRSYQTEESGESQNSADTSLITIEITRKNQSHAVTGLHVVTGSGAFDLEDEYGIREFLSPKGLEITEHDGSVTMGGALLPSAYFTLQIISGESLKIEGKGYGHGVGMSQTAANEMALQGYTCQEILDYFFKDVEVQTVVTNRVSW